MFTIEEEQLARGLGVARETLTTLRPRLKKGADWDYVPGKNARARVCYSPAGETAARAALAADVQPRAVAAQEFAQAVTARPREVQIVHAWPRVSRETHQVLGNPRILTAYLPGRDPNNPANLVRVQVRSTANFRPWLPDGSPMRVRVVHVAADLYELAPDQRLPRNPGRW
jgi:hypothetical protein